MSLGRRIIHRGRAAISATAASTPREALLFLYPAWIRKSSTAVREVEGIDGGRSAWKGEGGALRDTGREERVSAAKRSALQPPWRRLRTFQPTTSDDRWFKTPLGAPATELEERLPKLWHEIFADLIKHTPRQGQWLNQAVEVAVPLESLGRLVHGIDDYILGIGEQYGVQIAVSPRDEDTQQFRRFVISGSRGAIGNATDFMLGVAPNLEIKYLDTATEELDTGNPSLGGNVTSEEADEIDDGDFTTLYYFIEPSVPKLNVPPENIQRPEEWTHQSLLEYVRKVIKSNVSNHLHKYGFQRRIAHHTAVGNILRSLVQDPACKPFLSRTAVHEMMMYFVSTMQLDDVKKLFVHLEMSKLPMTPGTFNLMMSGATKIRDFESFHRMLHLMVQRGFVPNGRTWLEFINISPAKNPETKERIVAAMKEKQLTSNPKIMKRVIRVLIQSEISASLELKQSHHEFVAHMDEKYGKLWVSVATSNFVLHRLSSQGLISRCVEFLHFAHSRSLKPNINAILFECRRVQNVTGAVDILRNLPTGLKFEPDQHTYNALFNIAWQSRSYNLARIIWRYACLSANTMHRMRSLVRESILASRYNERSNEHMREKWRESIGPVVFGDIYHGQHPSQILGKLNQEEIVSEEKRLGPSSEIPAGGLETESMDWAMSKANAAAPDTNKTSTPEAQSGLGEGGQEIHEPHENSPQSSTLNNTPNTNPEISSQSAVNINPSSDTELQARLTLHESLLYDLEIYKEWEPVRPFIDMLVEAHERDLIWKGEVDYQPFKKERRMREAIGVGIRLKDWNRGGAMGPGKKEVIWR